MKKIIVALFLLGATMHLCGQSPVQSEVTDSAIINWGPKLKIKKKGRLIKPYGYNKTDRFKELLAHNKTGSFLLMTGRIVNFVEKDKRIVKLNNHLKFENSMPLPLTYQKHKMELEELIYLNGKFLLLSSYKNSKLKKNYFFYQVINSSSLKLDGNIKDIGSMHSDKRRVKGDIGFDIARDSSKILLFFKVPYTTQEKYLIKVLDTNLNETWSQVIEMPYKKQYFTIKNYKVSEPGDVFVLGQKFSPDKDVKNYQYHIIRYLHNGDQIVDYELSLKGKIIKNVTYDINANGDLICSGMYSKGYNYSSGVSGVFFLTIDADTRKIVKESYKEFDESFITQSWVNKDIQNTKRMQIEKEKGVKMYNYDLRDIILKKDGGVILLAEQIYQRVGSYSIDDKVISYTAYYCNDVIVASVNPQGDIEWVTKIEKYQVSGNDGGKSISYALQIKENMMNFVYIEKAGYLFKKEELKEMKEIDEKSYLTHLVSINNNGEFNKQVLLNSSTDKALIIAGFSRQVSENKMLVHSSYRHRRKFGTMIFK